MCGIAGQVAFGPDGAASRGTVEAMCAAIAHRGPDDTGVWVGGRAALGNRRLSIIDLAGGHQPLSSEDGGVWAVQNGEIYNYRALVQELTARGHVFRTASDTEVLVHGYEEYGPAIAERLRGMFAFAVWDAAAERLVVARDRLGIKPLVYRVDETGITFASEIKALLAAGAPRQLDRLALHDYLSFNYVPGPRTIFEGIAKLPAGHLLTWDAASGVEVRRWWDFPAQGEPPAEARDFAGAKAALRERLEDAVAATMVSDVPVGAFLSGGLDSSLVVALMGRVTEQPVRTFAVGFREKSYDERPWARRVAAHCGTEHHELVVEPDIRDIVQRLALTFDEPFADSSAVGAWVVAEAAVKHVKVMLSGDGGDEVFGGYVIYQADRLAGLYRRLPALLGERALPAIAERLPASDAKMSWELKLKRFTRHARLDPAAAHGAWRLIFGEEDKRRLYASNGHGTRAAGAGLPDSLEVLRRLYAAYPGDDRLNRFLVLDARLSLVDDMLTKVDRTSMAHGLEVRVPLLDHELVEWVTRLPSDLKVRGLTLKVLLREVAKDLLPQDVARRPKAGFHVPVPAWLKGELAPLVEEVLGEDTVRRQGVFEPAAVRAVVEAHRAGRENLSRNVWGLLMFGLWYRSYLEEG
jgi:asparagine synthase (glutamine-hydrolysing)